MTKAITSIKAGSYFTKHAGGVTVYHDGKSYAASSAHPNYELVLNALAKTDVARAASLLDVKSILEAASKGIDRISFKNGRMMYKGLNGTETELKGPLIDRILNAMRSDNLSPKQIRPLMMFLDNTMKNQLKDIREELYEFLMSGAMPITSDGCFLAYKKVKNDFKDVYTGKLDNSPGTVVAMDPAKVDRNRNNTCSTGLHFASRSYMRSYSGDKIVIVKVNPRNVFAIPVDYNCAKGRASEYFVVGEATGNVLKDEVFLQPFIFDENQAEAAPEVKFIEGGMKASLRAMAEGYKLAKYGKAYVRISNTKGPLGSENYAIAREVDGSFIDPKTGKPVPKDQIKLMSIETKSVRAALVRAVAKARKSLQ